MDQLFTLFEFNDITFIVEFVINNSRYPKQCYVYNITPQFDSFPTAFDIIVELNSCHAEVIKPEHSGFYKDFYKELCNALIIKCNQAEIYLMNENISYLVRPN